MDSHKNRIERTNNGVKSRGELKEIAEFSEEIKRVLENICEEEEPIEDFDFWKPECRDDEENIKNRTAKVASIRKRKSEQNDNGLKEDFSEAKKSKERNQKIL